jgi:hypothetical protein
VSVLLPPLGDVMLAGEKAAVTPFGNPVTDRAMAAGEPFWSDVVNVTVARVPAARVVVVLLDVNVKVGATIASVS